MKTVRLSESLKSEIRENAKKKFKAANPEREYPRDGMQIFTDEGYQDKINATVKHFKETWGYDCPMESVDTLAIRARWEEEQDDGEGNTHVKEHDESFNLNLPDIKVPTFLCRYREMNVEVEADNAVFLECMEVRMQNKNTRDRLWDEDYKLKNVLDEFATLNQLMKSASWLQPLIPAERLQKMHEKDDRGERVKHQAELADNELSSLRETILEDALLGDDT